ncbi:hypothetical protein Y1Q_0003182 [Alligator mississippiensis]|uniref:Uncharacterized protein n=1 Tax=Alligator mississippiensis TaxID=8496 RepID=A0A151MDV4_ALLMI|nr:hypothetical protein Y1Q_0003182 [Alligator mississippiensis]
MKETNSITNPKEDIKIKSHLHQRDGRNSGPPEEAKIYSLLCLIRQHGRPPTVGIQNKYSEVKKQEVLQSIICFTTASWTPQEGSHVGNLPRTSNAAAHQKHTYEVRSPQILSSLAACHISYCRTSQVSRSWGEGGW